MKKTVWMLTMLLALAMLLTAGGMASAEEVITPELIFYVNNGGYTDMVSHPYAVIPSDFEAPAGFSVAASFTAVVDNGYHFLERDQAGTGPVWSVKQIAGDLVPFTTTESNYADESRPYISVTLDATPQTAQNIVFQITCDWGDYATETGTGTFTMEFLDVELPSADTSMEIIEMQVGVEQPFTLDFDPPLAWDNGETRCNLYFSQNDFFPSDYSFITSWENTLTPLKAGNVTGNVQLYYANLYLEKQVLFRIADEEGNYPEPVPEPVLLDDAHFPDPGFRAYIAQEWDRNGDDGLDPAEIVNARWVSLLSEKAMSLEGIGYLPYLQHISINNTPVSGLDLKENTRLDYVTVINADLTELDVTGLTGLHELWLENNPLQQLDIGTNPNLQELCIRGTGIRSLDLSGNPLLAELDVSRCQGLRELDLSHNPALKEIYCNNCRLTELDVSHNTALEKLECAQCKLTVLDLSQNPALRAIYCEYNHLTSLDLSGCAERIEYFLCAGHEFTVDNPVRIQDLPGNFDPQKMSDLTGATLSEDGWLTLTEPYATYTYDCGKGCSGDFKLKQRYEGPSLSCEATQVLIYEELTIRIEDERTEDFSFEVENEVGETFYARGYRDWSREEEGNAKYYKVWMDNFGPSGTILLKVCSLLPDGITTEYSELSFNYTNNGSLEILSSDLPDTHALATPLTVTLQNMAENSVLTYSLRILYEDGSAFYFSGRQNGNTILYPAEEFAEPGRYLFTASQRKTGWVESEEYEKEFTVEGNVPPAPSVTASEQNVLKDSSVLFTIRAEGMTAFRYRAMEDGEVSTFLNPRVQDGVTTYSTRVEQVRDWDYSFSARVNGIWSEWSEPLRIHVYSLGTLEVPDLGISETLRAGEPVSVALPETPADAKYNIRCTSTGSTPDFHRASNGYPAGEEFLFLPFGLDPGTYEITVSVSATGYESGDDRIFPLTVTGVRPGAPELEIPETYTVGKIVPIRVVAEGMDAAAITYWRYDSKLYYAEDGSVTVPYLAKADLVTFRARINGVWSEATREFGLPSPEEFYGGQPGPELTMADRIALGEDLPVQVGPVPGAGWYAYNVSWHDPEEDEWTDIIYEKYIDAGSGSLTIPSAELSLPGEYRITVNVYLADDYCTYLCATTEELTVYRDGQADPAPVVSMQKDSWLTGEDILFSVSQPAGANTLRAIIYYDSEDWSWLEDTRTVEFPVDGILRLNFDDGGTYRAIFATRRNGIWSDFCEPVFFTVEEPDDSLPDPGITVPEEAAIGEGMTISWTPSEGAEQYELQMFRYDSTIDSFRVLLGSDVTEYTIETGSIPDLTGGYYRVEVWARAVGFNSGWGSRKVSMLDPAIRPSVSQVSADGGQAVIRVTGIVSERLRLRVNGKETGYLQADPGQSTREYRLPMTSDPMMVSVANYGSNPATWSTWSAPVSVSSAVALYPDSIVLPEELTTIEKDAFAGIHDGVNIVCGRNIREIDPAAFGNSQVLLVVPPDSYALQWAETHDVPYLVRAE